MMRLCRQTEDRLMIAGDTKPLLIKHQLNLSISPDRWKIAPIKPYFLSIADGI